MHSTPAARLDDLPVSDSLSKPPEASRDSRDARAPQKLALGFDLDAPRLDRPAVSAADLPFGLRLLDTPEGRNQASLLINRMYGWRGYGQSHHLTDEPCRVTFAAHDRGELAVTLTVGLGSQAPLAAEELFAQEIQERRDQGAIVCEVVKLACDMRSSKAMLGALFHFALMHATEIHGCTDAFIEVNPRHRRFYEQMLGFSEIGSLKICPRVNAPAHLLWMDIGEMSRRALELGGQGAASSDRSLYPWFFSPREAEGLANRIKAQACPCAPERSL